MYTHTYIIQSKCKKKIKVKYMHAHIHNYILSGGGGERIKISENIVYWCERRVKTQLLLSRK